MARTVTPSLQTEIADRIPDDAARGISRGAIAGAVAAIAALFHPERIVLFGSRASGTARPGSDIDLLVVLEPPPLTRVARTPRADEIRTILRAAGIAHVHPTMRTTEQIRVGLAEGDFFIADMLRGIVLFQTDERGEDRGRVGDEPSEEQDQRAGGLKRSTREWLTKGERETEAMRRLMADTEPLLDMVCFLGQQSAEKYQKAFLQERGMRFGRTNDLALLAGSAARDLTTLTTAHEDLAWLGDYGMAVRYPGAVASREDAQRAFAPASLVRQQVRNALELPEDEARA